MAIGAQWLAWRIRIPSILILLFLGFAAGPVLGLLDPDALMGDLLFPFISLSVGIILFEGGLTLRLNELPVIQNVITRLVTVSALVTWALATTAALLILKLSFPIALLLGAILIVTGPTVVGPLLRQIRPKGRIGAVLKWEGILIDPIGAIIAVLVFEAIVVSQTAEIQEVIIDIARTIGSAITVGGFIGITMAALLVFLLWQRLVPDYLQNAVTLMIVAVAFAVSNFIQPESGLITTTVMGIILANQAYASVRHIEEFTENIQVMLIGALFILLSARVSLNDILSVGPSALLFLAIMIAVVRPISAYFATAGSELTWKEWLFASVMAPRGIVAAAVASIFAFELSHVGGFKEAELLVPFTFVIIVGTVLFYGLAADPIARMLGLSERNPQGVLFVGSHRFARAIAKALQDQGFRTMLLDTNANNIRLGEEEGLTTYYGNALSEHLLENLDLSGIGRMFAMTANNEINSLASLHFPEVFSRAEVYQLSTNEPMNEQDAGPQHLRGRFLFDKEMTYSHIFELLQEGAVVEVFTLNEQFTAEQYLQTYGARSIALFVIDERKQLLINTADIGIDPQDGQTLISLISPAKEVELPAEVETDHDKTGVDEFEAITHQIYQQAVKEEE
jgi:NhaP-type Na+/H+ or K+/H+ antiporter